MFSNALGFERYLFHSPQPMRTFYPDFTCRKEDSVLVAGLAVIGEPSHTSDTYS